MGSWLILPLFALCTGFGPAWGAAHPFGTDQFGRDVLSLVVHGARPSLLTALGATLLGVGGGVALGLVAGFFGGWIDALDFGSA